MGFKIALAVCVTLAASVLSQGPQAGPAGGWGPPAAWGAPGGPWAALAAVPAAAPANPWIPPWISQAAWFPQWGPCTTIGSTCVDCNTKLVCTKIGGLQRACTDPTLPYCNLGQCSATPTAECAPATTAPADTAA